MYTIESHNSKELFSSLNESYQVTRILDESSKQEYQSLLEESDENSKKKVLVVEVAGIHVGKTANHVFYTEKGLEEGISSWVHPYNKPVLTHHDAHGGEPIGRILEASMYESEMTGRKGIKFKIAILDEKAQEKVLDGRYQTVSIGASTDKAICNICGTNRAQEWCNHWKGETYEGVQCHYSTGTVSGREVSYVNVPADQNAGNISMSFAEQSALQISEGLIVDPKNPRENMFMSLEENLKQDFKEEANRIFSILSASTGGSEDMKLEEALGKVKELETQLEESTKQVGNLTINLNKKEEELSEKVSENEKLIQENTELKKVSLKNLISEVVEMKVSLGKPDTKGVTKEELIEKHSTRTKESLEDLHSDLSLEIQEKELETSKGQVDNPTVQTKENDESGSNNTESNYSVDEAYKAITSIIKKGENK